MSAAELVQEYNALPEHLRQEVADFIALLKQKNNPSRQAAKEPYDSQTDLDGPITGYEDYIMDWSL